MAGRMSVVRGTITELHFLTESPYLAWASSASNSTGTAAEAATAGLKPGRATSETCGNTWGAGTNPGKAISRKQVTEAAAATAAMSIKL